MENNGFEKYAKAWNKADLSAGSQKVYSEEQIKKIKMKTSQDFSNTIYKSIIFDFVLKGVLIGGLLLLTWFYRETMPLLILLISIIGLTGWLIYREFNILQKLKSIDDYTQELREIIKMKLTFYKEQFQPLKLMLAFTNALFVWIGSMFYLYSKYGYYMIDDIDDKIVGLLMVTIAFGGSYLITNWHMKPKVAELEESLENLDDNKATTLQLQLRERQKKRQKFMMIIFAIVGTLLFAFLIITYLIQLF